MALLLCLFFTEAGYAREVIIVNNQAEFDRINAQLIEAINGKEKDIRVYLMPGQYECQEQHIQLTGLKQPLKSVRFIGKGAVLVPKGNIYHQGDKYSGRFTVNHSWMSDGKDVEIWSRVRYADGLIEVLDAKTKACRLKGRDPFKKGADTKNAYILVSQWYMSYVYKIDRIEGNYIYFTANNLAPKPGVAGGYNVNNDYYYAKEDVRYKICNLEKIDGGLSIVDGLVNVPDNMGTVREGLANSFIKVEDCEFGSLSFENIKIEGGSNLRFAGTIELKKTPCKRVLIKGCEFTGIRSSSIINIESTPNVVIENNLFRDCYQCGIQTDNESANTVVKENSFLRMGKRMNNTFSVACRGKDFSVTGNYFEDYGYGAITCGVWYGSPKTDKCSGIVEDNTLVYTDGYISTIENHSLMDSGAIYLATKMDGVIVRNNRINGFSGAGDNRGIFCDDGAYNFELVGNIINGIKNSYCIDARRCPHVEITKVPNSGVKHANVNIVIRDNVVDGTIRFEGNEIENNGCEYGTNYFVNENGIEMPVLTLSNVKMAGESIGVDSKGNANGTVLVSPDGYKKLKKNKEWRKVRKYIKKVGR